MENKSFSPEESLSLISRTIEETKVRFRENGHLLLFWGLLITFITLSQFILLQLELREVITFDYTIRNWPVFLYPLGAVLSYIHGRRKEKRNNIPRTITGNILTALGMTLGFNCIILGFFFNAQLGSALVPVFLIFLSFWTIIAGVAIKFKPLLTGGIALNILAFVPFFINWQYHSLIMTTASVIAFVIPGILLNIERKKENV